MTIIPLTFLRCRNGQEPLLDEEPLAELTQGSWILGRDKKAIRLWTPEGLPNSYILQEITNDPISAPTTISREHLKIRLSPEGILLSSMRPNNLAAVYRSWRGYLKGSDEHETIPFPNWKNLGTLIDSSQDGKVRGLKLGDWGIPLAFYALDKQYKLE